VNAPGAAAGVAEGLARHANVRRALELIEADDGLTLQEQIAIAEIPAPPFKEAGRARDYLRRMQILGLTDACIDEEGNVVGMRKGTAGASLLVVSAHLDTVFAEGEDVRVTERKGRYYGRGLGDNSRGLAAVLAVLRAMQAASIRTVGDVMFVGTVGEEGLGELRGAKALFRDHPNIDGFISVDGMSWNKGEWRIVANANGSHRWEARFIGPGGHHFADFGVPSAVHALGRAIAHIGELDAPTHPRTTFTVELVSGGALSTIAADATMLVDICSSSEQQLLRTEQQIMAAIEDGAADENAHWGASTGVRVESKLIGERPAGTSLPDSPVILAGVRAMKALGLPVPSLVTGSSDSNLPISLGIPAATLCAGGGVGGAQHSADEWYDPVDAWLGPQAVLLTILVLAGVDGISEPQLPVRQS
jgi:acetylornithine deacetylase/succinyl-diaminopimelate desuccinylase-like protein